VREGRQEITAGLRRVASFFQKKGAKKKKKR
jgi:hypothetical protein